jgi:dTMP kinase
LIIFEGIDGAGKSTQLRRCAVWLKERGYLVSLRREPTNSPYGETLRKSAGSGRLPPEEETELFLQDRRWNIEQNLLPDLKAGKVVLLDRYYFSTIAYQGARGLDAAELRRRNEAFAPKPDLVLLFDLDPETALQRILRQRGEAPDLFEKVDYLRKVREIFLSLSDPFIVHIDAAPEPDEVWRQVETALSPLFPVMPPLR